MNTIHTQYNKYIKLSLYAFSGLFQNVSKCLISSGSFRFAISFCFNAHKFFRGFKWENGNQVLSCTCKVLYELNQNDHAYRKLKLDPMLFKYQ